MQYLKMELADKDNKLIPNLVDTSCNSLTIPIDDDYIAYANDTYREFISELLMGEYEAGTKLSFTVIKLDLTLKQYKEKYDDTNEQYDRGY